VNGQFGPFGRGFDEINPGDRGADVLAIQQRLRQLGYYAGELDGIYEDNLKKAVHTFQRASGLKAQNTITRETWLKMGFREFE
jgi:peptidoglycan hydrolase-like protein with peptidoglycan-binding domain